MVAVDDAGRIINPTTARSQLAGGMVWGISMALCEHNELDERYGDFNGKDLASYHVATSADVPNLDVTWVDEIDLHIAPVLLGDGIRLFDNPGGAPVRLELLNGKAPSTTIVNVRYRPITCGAA